VLAGGPVRGGAVSVPPNARLAVEQVLGTRLPVR
jgi:hypothetical protein